MLLQFNDALVDEDGNTWFAENRWNSLFIKKNNSKIEFIGVFPEEEIVKTDEFRNMAICASYIVFTPFDACNIHMVNPKTRDMICIKVDNDNIRRFKEACLYGTFVYDDSVFFLQACDTQLIVLNVKTRKIKKIDIVDRKTSENYKRYRSHRVIKRGKMVYLCDEVGAKVVEFDPIKECVFRTHIYKKFMDEISDFIVDYDGNILLADKDGNVYKDEIDTIERIDTECDEISFVKYDNDIYLFSLKEKKVIHSMNNDGREVEKINGILGKTRDAIIVGECLFTQNDEGIYYKDFVPFEKCEIDENVIDLPQSTIFLKESRRIDLSFFVQSGMKLFGI